MDREKVEKALEICEKKDCVLCPYTDWCGEYDDSFYDCTKLLAKDTIALLKEQEETINDLTDTIVRCKDCKHGFTLTDSTFVTCGCRFHDGQKHEADWFCADGERKEI